MNSVADVLEAAKAKIDTPERWVQQELARKPSVHGDGTVPANPDDPAATAFCSIGAVCSVLGLSDYQFLDMPIILRASLNKLANEIENLGYISHRYVANSELVADWNDRRERDHAEVMALFDAASASARKDSQMRFTYAVSSEPVLEPVQPARELVLA